MYLYLLLLFYYYYICCCYLLEYWNNCVECVSASARLIPYSSQQRYVFTNKVSIRELYGGDAEQSSYTLKSLLTINSVWNKGDEQLLQAFFSETFVSTLNKISKEHVEEITKIPDKPFYISLVNGKPQKVIAYTLRDQSLLNIEKGLASLLQIQWEKDTVKEVDVSGECNVFYRYKSSNRIEKIKKDCTNWDLKVNYRSEKPLGKIDGMSPSYKNCNWRISFRCSIEFSTNDRI